MKNNVSREGAKEAKELVERLPQAINSGAIPEGLSAAKEEYFKAGARAVIRRVNEVLPPSPSSPLRGISSTISGVSTAAAVNDKLS